MGSSLSGDRLKQFNALSNHAAHIGTYIVSWSLTILLSAPATSDVTEAAEGHLWNQTRFTL